MYVSKFLFVVLLGVQTIQGQSPTVCIIRNLLSCASHLGFDKFTNLAERAGINKDFDFIGPKTLLLPSNDALDSIPDSVKNELQKNQTYLIDVLHYHLITKSVKCMDLDDNTKEPTKQGANIRFNTYSSKDGTLVVAEGATFNTSIREVSSITGKICVINKMLYDIPRQSIYSYISQDRSLTTFLLLASKSGSLDVFKGSDMTLLVPDNKAFSKLAPGVLQNLTEHPSLMKGVIDNHIANSVEFYRGLLFTKSFRTVSGEKYAVKISGKDDFIGPAKILKPDVLAFNGVVHIIDTVLLNPNSTMTEELDNMTF